MFLGSTSQLNGNFRTGLNALTAPVRHVVIGSGDSGIYQTVRLIKQKVQEALSQPVVIQTVRSILAGLPQNASQVEKSQAMVKWWMANIRYRLDDDMSYTEHGLQWVHINQCPMRYKSCEPVEMISDVPQILAQKYEDCDGFVTGLGAFHSMAGIKWCPVIVALDASIPKEFSHIYLIANLDGSWVPIDAVNANQPWGWEAEGAFRKEVLC